MEQQSVNAVDQVLSDQIEVQGPIEADQEFLEKILGAIGQTHHMGKVFLWDTEAKIKAELPQQMKNLGYVLACQGGFLSEEIIKTLSMTNAQCLEDDYTDMPRRLKPIIQEEQETEESLLYMKQEAGADDISNVVEEERDDLVGMEDDDPLPDEARLECEEVYHILKTVQCQKVPNCIHNHYRVCKDAEGNIHIIVCEPQSKAAYLSLHERKKALESALGN